MDLLGFGDSAKPVGVNYDPHLWKDQVVAFVREVIQTPVMIVGNSIGSQVGKPAYARCFPVVPAADA